MSLTGTIACLLALGCSPGDTNTIPGGRLTMSANTATLMQRDILLVRATFHSSVDEELEVQSPDDQARGYYFRIQLHKSGRWTTLPSVSDIAFGLGAVGEPGRSCIAGRTSYAEYNWYHRTRSEFIFEDIGIYRLRAIARIAGREVTSNEVSIEAKERPVDSLEQIQELDDLASEFSFPSLRWHRPEKFLAVRSAGGNIGVSINNFMFVQEFALTGRADGKPIGLSEFCSALRKSSDSVSYENSMTLLIRHYLPRRDVESLAYVLNQLPYDSGARREGLSYLHKHAPGPDKRVELPSCAQEK